MSEQGQRSPRKFTDAEGVEWEVRITYGLRGKLKTEVGFDPLAVFVEQYDNLRRLLADPEQRMQALWLALERQAAAREVTPEAFADRLDGAAWEASGLALSRAVIDFFPEPELRLIGHAAIDKGLEVMTEAGATAAELIRGLPVDFASNDSNGSAGTAPSSPAETATTSV